MKTDMCDVKQKRSDVDDRVGSKRVSKTRACQEHGERDCPSENEHEFESLEYEEDVYYSNLTATPSFDDIDEISDDADEIVVHCWRDSNGEIDEIVVDDGNLSVETEFLSTDPGAAAGSRGRRKRRSVRVIFQDFSKPYLAKISNSRNYKKFLELVKGAAYVYVIRGDVHSFAKIFFCIGSFKCGRYEGINRGVHSTKCLLTSL